MINLLVLGVAAEITGRQFVRLPEEITSVNGLKEYIVKIYPELKVLKFLLVAVNRKYADGDQAISQHDEVALVPPISEG